MTLTKSYLPYLNKFYFKTKVRCLLSSEKQDSDLLILPH